MKCYIFAETFPIAVQKFDLDYSHARKTATILWKCTRMHDEARFTLVDAIIHVRIFKTRMEDMAGVEKTERETYAVEVGRAKRRTGGRRTDKKLRARSESYDFSAA